MRSWLTKWHSSADDRASLPEAVVRPSTDPEIARHSYQGEAYRLMSVCSLASHARAGILKAIRVVASGLRN